MAKGDIPEAVRISGVSRSRLYSLLKKHRLSPKIPFTEFHSRVWRENPSDS